MPDPIQTGQMVHRTSRRPQGPTLTQQRNAMRPRQPVFYGGMGAWQRSQYNPHTAGRLDKYFNTDWFSTQWEGEADRQKKRAIDKWREDQLREQRGTTGGVGG